MFRHLPEIKDSFPEMEKLFSNKELIKFIQTPPEELHRYHLGLGTWIRNHILQDNPQVCNLFIEMQATHPDDMSAIIMEEFQEYLLEKRNAKKKKTKKK